MGLPCQSAEGKLALIEEQYGRKENSSEFIKCFMALRIANILL